MLVDVKMYEAKFLGMPLGREESSGAKKGKLIRSPEPEMFGDIGEMDAKKDSPTYGMKSCIVGKTYTLDQWKLAKYGAAFEVVKEVKGYVIDDGRTDEVEAIARKQYQKESAERRAKNEAEALKVTDKASAEKIAADEKEKSDAIAAKKGKKK